MQNINGKSDTIVAVATPPGKGGIAVVKISGPDSVTITKHLFKGSKDPSEHNRVMVYGHIVDDGEPIDEVLFCVMKAPNSYTGETVVEIQCHGGYAAASTILELVVNRGARIAEPGEFTKRAFLNGRIDLAQAESVMEIVSAEGKAYLTQAEKLMDGVFSRHIEHLLEDITKSASLLELNIDFLHQGIEAIKKDELTRSLESTIKTLNNMIASYTVSQRIKDGLRAVLAGKTNVGKSSLFNTLLGRKRAIVNASPGTTRDWIEGKIELEGVTITLIDTAGLRETDNEIEHEGVKETERLLSNADLVIYLEEACSTKVDDSNPFESTENVISVLSKSDLLDQKPDLDGIIPVSSKTGEGINELLEKLTEKAFSLLINTNNSLVIVDRHRNELKKAKKALKRALQSMDTFSEEVTAFELNEASKHLEAILGRSIDSDVLDEIFKNFCIGK